MVKAVKGKRYRHRKGGKYVVIEIAEHTEMTELMVVYRRERDGTVWVRPKILFEDGRYEEIPHDCG